MILSVVLLCTVHVIVESNLIFSDVMKSRLPFHVSKISAADILEREAEYIRSYVWLELAKVHDQIKNFIFCLFRIFKI